MDDNVSSLFHMGYFLATCAFSILIGSTGTSLAFGEEPTDSTKSVSTPPKEVDKKKAVQSTHSYSTGVFYGRIHVIHPDKVSLEVSAIEESKGRRLFFLDRETKFDLNGKSAKVLILQPGQKVAVRFFAQDSFAMADEIYVVSGDFVPEKYNGLRKRRGR